MIVDGKIEVILLGKDLEGDEVLQATIPANCWFASQVKNKVGFSLVSCTVAPGFDFADFESGSYRMAKKVDLQTEYPKYVDVFDELCLG